MITELMLSFSIQTHLEGTWALDQETEHAQYHLHVQPCSYTQSLSCAPAHMAVICILAEGTECGPPHSSCRLSRGQLHSTGNPAFVLILRHWP